MQRLEVSGAVRPLYESLGIKGLNSCNKSNKCACIKYILYVCICWFNHRVEIFLYCADMEHIRPRTFVTMQH